MSETAQEDKKDETMQDEEKIEKTIETEEPKHPEKQEQNETPTQKDIVEYEATPSNSSPTQNDIVEYKATPSNSTPDQNPVENSVKSPGLQYLFEAMLRDGNSTSRSPQSAGLMDHQLKRNQDERLNACKKIMSYVNSADFSTLNDKEIRAFLMIREISCGVIIGQRKLPNDHDVSRVLKDSIERMVVTCRKMVDQISGMDFHDLNEQERQSLTMILKIAREIISKQGAQYEDDI